jgi:hypothetical protein
MSPDAAAETARDALIWMVGEPGVLASFLDATGSSPQDLRALADDPDFLGSVLDHVLSRDDLVLSFASAAGVPPERVAEARAALPGGAAMNWT